MEVTLTRDQFEGIIEPMLTAIIDITRKLLRDINFTPDLIDQVLLVGGSSLITAVISALEKEFGREKVMIHVRPMLAVAEGAAILSHRLSAAYECPRCGKEIPQSEVACPHCYFDMEKHFIDQGFLNIVHTTAHDYYIRLENNENYLLIEKNTPLPCQKTRVFNLIHPEQKLVHMKFINIVNEDEESIGELWLGIDDKEQDNFEILSEEALQVELTIEIDESNILQITAAIKAMPHIKVSRTLSRGKADEKLFLNLEEIINEANQKQYNHFVMDDLTHNALSIIKNITQVVNANTGEVNEDIYQRAMLKTDKARAMAAENYAPRATICYGQNALDNFGPAISPETQNKIIKSINTLEKMEEAGSYTEHIKAYENLKEIFDTKELRMITLLMEIKKAGEYCLESDPAQASRFYQAINNILQAIENRHGEKVNDILDEIMPEVANMLMVHDTKTGKIHKNLTK